MKRPGFSIIEFIIAISVFLIGVMALAMALTFDLKVVVRSKEAIQADQGLINEVNIYMIDRVISHDISPSGANATLEDSGQELLINGKPVKFSLYRYQRENRDSVVYNVIQREE